MKRILLALIALPLLSCGSESGPVTITGPILDISEATSLVVDQFYVNSGMDDEFSKTGEFAIYLRDAGTGQDLACAGGAEGMVKLATPATYYGDLDVALREIESTHPESSARLQIVVVEKDSEDCPKPINADDDIAGISKALTIEEILNKTIWTTNGLVAVTLRAQGTKNLTISAMVPSLASGLFLDKLSFTREDSEKEGRYFLIAERIENGKSLQSCQLNDSLEMVKYGMTYAALGLPISCYASTDPDFSQIPLKMSLWQQLESGPQLVGETEIRTIANFIGEKVLFTNDQGYLSFQTVATTPFFSSVVRLAELADLKATALNYSSTPAANTPVELHIFADGMSSSLVCAGKPQGLSNVASPGNYSNLDAGFVAVTGQKELFGSSNVTIKLVNRTDGKECPAALSNTPTELASTSSLTSSVLPSNALTFLNNAGSVSLSLK
ncbi:MAG: hypothetical protein HY540_03600 [Deltaproteobacteria bacterium]|nr:hypothetical protein [Deltaproteobacteria bacterium]